MFNNMFYMFIVQYDILIFSNVPDIFPISEIEYRFSSSDIFLMPNI